MSDDSTQLNSSESPADTEFVWRLGDQTLQRGRIPLLMGILNVTPDSFSDGGQHNTVELAVQHGLKLAEEGADIIDVGGESTRPGSLPVSVADELQRTVPVIERLTGLVDVPISIDTTKAEVARQAIDAGARIVNDISGATFDPQMLSLCAETGVGVCLMHIKGTPQDMQEAPSYENVVTEVEQFLRERLEACLAAGISAESVCLDPGIGFGKTAEHNLTLMKAISQLRSQLHRPLLVGHSRKRFLSRLLGRSVEERLAGTLGVSVALAAQGTDILRIHDVQAVRDTLLAWQAVAG
jgi:dihydropteroate synthase